jgi:hypothetical protein
VSQLCPRTIEAEESREVTKNVKVMVSPVEKVIGSSRVSEITEFEVPSNNLSLRGGIAERGRSYLLAKSRLMKQ